MILYIWYTIYCTLYYTYTHLYKYIYIYIYMIVIHMILVNAKSSLPYTCNISQPSQKYSDDAWGILPTCTIVHEVYCMMPQCTWGVTDYKPAAQQVWTSELENASEVLYYAIACCLSATAPTWLGEQCIEWLIDGLSDCIDWLIALGNHPTPGPSARVRRTLLSQHGAMWCQHAST